ncbi:MAG: carbon monoxide dehydrogenase, partial [Peptococcaceae bacterium]|nr:carbon monoxide dehydrogenase [Peptococcaceae bacterium]
MSDIRTVDPAAREMLELDLGISTQFDRYLAQQPQCRFGLTGVCCKICIQGPCRIIPTKKGADRGICGARDYTIVARNVARLIAGGASAHSDHGREIAHTLLLTAEGKAPDYRVKDSEKLYAVAKKVGIETEGRRDLEIAKDVAILALEDFGKHTEEPCTWLTVNIDDERKKKFKKTRIAPPAIDRSVVQLLHQTHMGTDADPVSIIFGGLQAGLSDFTGMSLATDISDILFGTPEAVVTSANLGTLKKEMINIAVHGHNPLLSEMIVQAAKELEGEAKANGASGINLVGICCTGNEVLTRQRVPMATNFGSQEPAIMTGVLDAMVMDVQCIAP